MDRIRKKGTKQILKPYQSNNQDFFLPNHQLWDFRMNCSLEWAALQLLVNKNLPLFFTSFFLCSLFLFLYIFLSICLICLFLVFVLSLSACFINFFISLFFVLSWLLFSRFVLYWFVGFSVFLSFFIFSPTPSLSFSL